MTAVMTAAQYAAWFDAQVGKPYVLGADGPKAWDCSGLVLGGMRASGAWVQPDMTAAGIYGRTVAVKGDPKVGDLVFLRNNPARSNGIGHVATITQKLSNGDWRIVEARGKASGVVRTTLSYWKTRKYYTGVRRIPAFRLAATAVSTPTPSAAVKLRVAELNCLDPGIHQGDGKLHPLTAARKDALVKVSRRAAADVYLLNEAPEATRNVLRDGLDGGRSRWKVWERGSQAILFDSKRLAHSSATKVRFSAYHGGVVAPLVDRKTGQRFGFGSFHLRPDAQASQNQQRADLAEFLAVVRTLPGVRIVGGDGMNSASWASGWTDARTAAKTSSTRTTPTYQGKSITDRILSDSQTPVTWDGYNVADSGAGSDHDLVVTALTVPGLVTV